MAADPMPPPGRVAVGRVAVVRVAAGGADAPTGPDGRLTRRTALAGLAATGAAFAVAACTPKQTTSAAELIAGDALGPAYTETSELIARYDRALASAPALVEILGPLREEHRQHLIALASLIGLAMPAVSAGPHPSGIPLPPPHPTASGSAPGTTTPTATPWTTPTTASPSSSAGTPPSAASESSTSPAGSAPPTGLAPSPSPATSVLPSGSPSTGLSTGAIKAQLSAAEKIAQANAVAACIAVAADRVPIVAAIAACRATHVAALR